MNDIISIKEFARQEKAKILANLKNQDFELADMVAASGMSRSKYIATFKMVFGKTPFAMVNELRLSNFYSAQRILVGQLARLLRLQIRAL